ncbi:MAG: hypothetical protein WD049_10090 [Candidatus Paceibacterota bacterium]
MSTLAKQRPPETPFEGFEPITGNFVYCPNQFFDVCLPHFPRGVVRIVGYVLRRTLGFVDARGEPIAETFRLPYSELIKEAGVGHDAIRDSIDRATKAGFIVCIADPRPKAKHQAAQSGCYALRWAEPDQPYTTDPNVFCGFFAGEGNRTPIPNAFFDRVLKGERLAAIKVVGSVLRHTIGYHTRFGRRTEAPLSFSYLQRYANIKNRTTLSEAVQRAIKAEYIACVQPGRVSPTKDQRRAATYAVKWLGSDNKTADSRKNVPAVHSEKRTSATIGKGDQQHSESRTSYARKRGPVDHSENRTTEKTLEKNILKQQHAAVWNQTGYDLLIAEGFENPIAKSLSRHYSAAGIERQINWIDHRHPKSNRLGMLRKAIEEDWQEPEHLHKKRTAKAKFQAQEKKFQSDDIQIARQKKRRAERKQRLRDEWQRLSISVRQSYIETAISDTTSESLRKFLRAKKHNDEPAVEFLDALARDRGLPTVVQTDSTDTCVVTNSPRLRPQQGGMSSSPETLSPATVFGCPPERTHQKTTERTRNKQINSA